MTEGLWSVLTVQVEPISYPELCLASQLAQLLLKQFLFESDYGLLGWLFGVDGMEGVLVMGGCRHKSRIGILHRNYLLRLDSVRAPVLLEEFGVVS